MEQKYALKWYETGGWIELYIMLFYAANAVVNDQQITKDTIPHFLIRM